MVGFHNLKPGPRLLTSWHLGRARRIELAAYRKASFEMNMEIRFL